VLPAVDSLKIAILGQGYVGLPLAIELGKKHSTIGFDIDAKRVADLRSGRDETREASPEELREAAHLSFTDQVDDIRGCNVYIVTVPTPVDASRRPNLEPLISASKTIASVISAGNVVVYESTVFPGATEEVCVPIIEELSGLTFNRDFFVGYSPERINPGDKSRPITKIRKVTSGSTPEAAVFVDQLYSSIIDAGTFPAASIRVAEAAKVIENTQRDVNIALMNELSIVFSHMGIDTHDVIDAAATKWNFIRLEPGLVGGHCIGVDPYYLIHRASIAGHIPDIIRRAREINDGMARHASRLLSKALAKSGNKIEGARVLVLGTTFKEDCPDTRNSKVVDFVHGLAEWGMSVLVHDPWAEPETLRKEYGLDLITDIDTNSDFDAIVLAVKHSQYLELGSKGIRGLMKPDGVFFDMKSAFPRDESDLRL